jgi:hypothetical protein
MTRTHAWLSALALSFACRGQEAETAKLGVRAQLDYAQLKAQEARREPLGAHDLAVYSADFERAVDDYIQTVYKPDVGTEAAIKGDLSKLWPNSSGLRPDALRYNFGGRDHLFVLYMMSQGGAGYSKPYLKAFKGELGRFVLSATADTDFDDHTQAHLERLKSVTPQETLFAVSARHSTANGLPRIRYRVYAYDGNSFRVVWAPDYFLDARISVEGDRIRVNRVDRDRYYGANPTPPYRWIEEYVVGEAGVKMITSELTDSWPDGDGR